MKRSMMFFVLLVAAHTLPSIGHAQMEMKAMEMKGMKSDGKVKDNVHKGSGTVTEVDPARGTVTIAHGPIQSLNWPSMTMSYSVKDKAMLEQVKPGVKVEFGFVQSGKEYLITEIK